MTEKETVLKEVLKLLGERYQPGLYEFLFRYRGDLHKQRLELEDRIDRACISGTLAELKEALRSYWVFHMKALEEFKRDPQLALDLTRVRQEMVEDRIGA